MSANEPLRTICAQVKGGHFSVVAPSLAPLRGTSEAHLGGHSIKAPLSTISAGGTHHALVGANLVTIGYGERKGQDARRCSVEQPLGTVVAGGVKQALVSAHLVDMGHGESCSTGAKRWSSGVRSLETPLNSVLASSIPSALVAAFFEQANGGFYDGDGRPADAPISTITAAGSNQRLVTAYLVKYYGSGGQWQALRMSLCIPCQRKPEWAWYKQCRFRPTSLPRNTLPARSSAQCCSMSTFHSTSQVRPTWFLLANWVLVDITLRMLKARELYRAQGFPESYVIE